jgi:hypothetical protein
VDNIGLRCRAHNGYEAEQFYGPIKDWLDTDAVTEAGPPRSGGASPRSEYGLPAN